MWNKLKTFAAKFGKVVNYAATKLVVLAKDAVITGATNIYDDAKTAISETTSKSVEKSKQETPGSTYLDKAMLALKITSRVAINTALGISAVGAATAIGGTLGGAVATVAVDRYLGTPTSLPKLTPYYIVKESTKAIIRGGVTLTAATVASGVGAKMGIRTYRQYANKVSEIALAAQRNIHHKRKMLPV